MSTNAHDPDNFTSRAEGVLRQIRAHEVSGAEDISSLDLQIAISQIRGMIDAVRNGTLPVQTLRHHGLRRMIVDQWPLGHPLGTEIGALEDLYCLLPER